MTVLTGLVLLVRAEPASAASAPVPSEEARFVVLVNAERAKVGLPALTVDPELTTIARDWAAYIADRNLLLHNPNLVDLITADWSRIGENVGYGDDVDYVMQLFVASPTHYPNIVESRVTRIGVGVVHDRHGRLWTAHQFMGVRTAASAPASPALAPSPAPPPAPAPTTVPAAPATSSAPTTTAPERTPTTAGPEPTELAASYPAGYQNDVLPEAHEVALAGTVSPSHQRGHADAAAMILLGIATGSLVAAGALRLRGAP